VADNQLRVGGAVAVWLVSLAWLSVGTPVATAANGLRMIAMDGQPAPGGVMPEVFRFLGAPLIDDRGDIAFSASLQSNNGGNGSTARASFSRSMLAVTQLPTSTRLGRCRRPVRTGL
jgi:hypothetical protein